MNNFLKDLIKLATELNQANGFDAVAVINEMELLYEKHVAELKKMAIHDVSVSLPVDFLQNEMVKAIKELAKESTAPDKDTPDWLESDIKRGAKWMYKRLTGNDC